MFFLSSVPRVSALIHLCLNPGGAGGAGGAGVPYLIDCCATPFSITAFAGGGGGGGGRTGGDPGGSGGSGGGGDGGKAAPSAGAGEAGTANTGGGGGGAGDGPPEAGNGGSGVVIVRFPSAATLAVSPGTNLTAAHPGGEKVAVFKASGTLTVS